MENIVSMYLTDTFVSPELKLDLGLTESKLCYFSKRINSFFASHGKLEDARPARLQTLGVPVDGTIKLHFDGAITAQKDIIVSMTDSERHTFFNTIERIYLTQTLDYVTLNEELSTTSEYLSYVQDSLFISATINTTSVTLPNDTVIEINLPSFFIFEFMIGGTPTKFKIWTDNQSFYDDYANSHITEVIFPCDASYFLNPNKYKTVLDAITISGKHSFNNTHTAVAKDDHTGLFAFETRYNSSQYSSTFMPFGIMYKGKRPSTLLIREAIRNELERLGIVPALTWESLFPDLYVKAQFYIVPMWHNTTLRVERTILPSVINYSDIMKVTKEIFNDIQPSFLEQNLEVIMNGYNEMFSVCIPDPLNVGCFSLLKLHPTYTYHSTQQASYVYMDKDTQDFNIYFSRCMGVVTGSNVAGLTQFVPVDLDGRNYMTFVSKNVEYYILMEESYPFELLK